MSETEEKKAGAPWAKAGRRYAGMLGRMKG